MAITRFRIEAEGHDKEALIEEIAAMASRTISAADESELQPLGNWECTQDVIVGDARKGYKARMVLKLENREHVTDGGECWCNPEVIHVEAK